MAAAGMPALLRGAHTVGVADGRSRLPVVGWSTPGGDLRIGHFFGLHAMQVVPLGALLLMRSRPSWLKARGQVQLTGVVGVALKALTLLLTWQALRGQPITAPDGLTTSWLLAIAIGLAVVALVVMARAARIGSALVDV